jgi:hypothetical protein
LKTSRRANSISGGLHRDGEKGNSRELPPKHLSNTVQEPASGGVLCQDLSK